MSVCLLGLSVTAFGCISGSSDKESGDDVNIGEGEVEGEGVVVDNDRDGVPAEEACDDNDASIPTAADPECDGFYLHTNEITVLCPDVAVDAQGAVDGVV